MTVLALALVSIFGAAVRESQVEPGVAPSQVQVRRGQVAMAVTVVVVVAILFLLEIGGGMPLLRRQRFDAVQATSRSRLRSRMGTRWF